jgi:hypothetical protein
MAKKRFISAKFRRNIAETRTDLKFHNAEISANILQTLRDYPFRFGHEAWTFSQDMKQEHGEWTCSMEMYMNIHVHVRICVVHVHVSVQTCTHLCTQKCTYTRTYIYINLLICSKISLGFADFTDGILPKRNETKHGLSETKFGEISLNSPKFRFVTKQKNYISGKTYW